MEVINMALTVSCQDLDSNCTYVAHGETEKELMADMGKHAKEVHGYTDEQLKDPEMMKKIKAAIKKE
jgi:predicted small metal-binding protein